ncbi:MAG: cytochrome b [Pseudomonadota bacterium]
MALRNTIHGWGWLARAFHWIIGLMIIGLLVVGFYMVEGLGDDSDSLLLRLQLTQTHKSFGFVVFFLALLRLVWRFLNPSPKLPKGMGRIEIALAHGGHAALYLAMIGMPITGWLMATSSPLNDVDAYIRVPNMVFGLFDMPDPFPKGSKEVSELWGSIHGAMGWALAIVLLGHVAAALKHHFVNRDTVLRRMIRG